MNISPLIAIVPVVLAVALIIIVVRRNITERQPGEPIDIAGAIPAFVILMVAVILIGGMASSAVPYSWDEDSGELTIKMNIPHQDVQPWDEYADEVRSLVIEDGVTIRSGAFDSLTNLEYVEIGEDVSLGSNVFGLTMKDYMNHTISAPGEGKYVAYSGTLYHADESIFAYSGDGATITGLTSSAASAVNIVIPAKHEGTAITGFGNSAFASKTTIQRVLLLPETYSITALASGTFNGCTGIAHMEIPGSVKEIGYLAMAHLDALTELELPASLETIGNQAFSSSAIADVVLPANLKAINANAFQNSSGLRTVSFPASLETIGAWAFSACSGVTQVSFAAGFAPGELASDAFRSWTFYESDGTTTIDKTDPANLAGFTFQGTASALVKVLPDRSALTQEQSLQVEELTKAASTEARTEISELDVGDKELQTFEIDASEQEKASA